mmetsp:Transcript_39438/g.93371  ORF Transcript_39438/g.93371 Transcript_39438/m.93371 type:complete len:285 (+) Transcript_39438:135-989(+)
MRSPTSALVLAVLSVPAAVRAFSLPSQLLPNRLPKSQIGTSPPPISSPQTRMASGQTLFPAPLLVDPETGAPLAAQTAVPTIHDVPSSVLAGGCECCMVIIRDPSSRRVLLQLPNALGWRYHFGVPVAREEGAEQQEVGAADGSSAAPSSRTRAAAAAARSELQKHAWVWARAGEGGLRERGVMFFTFVSDPPRQFPPMRVRVLELPLCASRGGEGGEAEGGGVWHAYEAVPYGEMWADDVLWMPQLLQHTGEHYFEGHFVFEGGPGKDSRVLQHNLRAGDVAA